jgi:hypothetical protein
MGGASRNITEQVVQHAVYSLYYTPFQMVGQQFYLDRVAGLQYYLNRTTAVFLGKILAAHLNNRSHLEEGLLPYFGRALSIFRQECSHIW